MSKRKAPDEPRDATAVREILESMGAADHDPAVAPQLIDFMFRHVTSVLKESKVYARHADKKEPDLEDVKLAVQTRVNFSFMQPPTREVVLQLTQKRNQVPLPLIRPKKEIRLPAEKFCLTAPNFQFNPPPKNTTDAAAAPQDAVTPPLSVGGDKSAERKFGRPAKPTLEWTGPRVDD